MFLKARRQQKIPLGGPRAHPGRDRAQHGAGGGRWTLCDPRTDPHDVRAMAGCHVRSEA